MGKFKRPVTVLTLEFEGELEGLVVRVMKLRTGEAFKMYRNGSSDDQEDVDRMLDMLAEKLVSWNMVDEETGGDIPADRSGIDSLEIDTTLKIVDAWVKHTLGDDIEDGELGKDFASGGTFPGPLPPMEAL